MRSSLAILALVVGIGVGFAIHGQWNPSAYAQVGGRGVESSIIVVNAPMAEGGQQVVLVETRDRVISSYHVDGKTGEIALKSVRNFRWDLLMDEFNGSDPKPREIKALLEQR